MQEQITNVEKIINSSMDEVCSCKNDEGKPWVNLLQFHRQAFEGVYLAILFVVLLAVFVPN